MAPKINAKAAAGRAAKEDVKAGKDAAKQKIAAGKEDEEWNKGAKGKGAKDDKAAKDEETRRKKEELRKITEAEEKAQSNAKPKVAPPKAAKASSSSSSARVPSASAKIPDFNSGLEDEVTSYSASNIDDMLDVMSLVSEKTDKASMGSKAAAVVSHPERRYPAAFEAYKEVQLPILKKEYKSLRLQQLNEMMFKAFKKSPDNPFNQVSVAYDATKEDKLAALKHVRDETSRRLQDN